MPAKEEIGGIGDHSFAARIEVCQDCHQDTPTFDVIGGRTKVSNGLQRLRETLNDLELLTRDGTNTLDATLLEDTDFGHDEPLPQTAVPADVAGALYNYLIVARGSALGIHNPRYVGQLLYDSIEAAGGDLSGITRPP
jgi:hypothetical protein